MIHNIRVMFARDLKSFFDLKVIDGGTGFDHVTIRIESNRKYESDVTFVLF